MAANVFIYNSDGDSIEGTVYLYDAGTEIGLSTVPMDGADIETNAAWANMTQIQITAPGFHPLYINRDQITENNYVYLERKKSMLVWFVVAAAAGYIITKVKF